MARVLITRLANDDLDSIQMHGLSEFGAKATLAYMRGFDRIFERLESHPLSGVAVPGYGRAIRSCLHRPYRVLYRFEGEVVSILRVSHTAQRVRKIDDTLQ
jgi:plasmid stabilization system protein ParE